LLEPALWFVLLGGVAHVARHNVVDLVVFASTAVLILVDARRTAPEVTPPTWRMSRPVAVLLCGLYALLVLPLAPDGWAMHVAVALPGIVALVVVERYGQPLVGEDPGPTLGRGVLLWAVLVLAFSVFQVYNFLQQANPRVGSYTHPTLSALLGPVLGQGVPSAVTAAIWLACGLWLLDVLVSRPEKVVQP
jgi:hypothetical protein